jgi:hypothetical protein
VSGYLWTVPFSFSLKHADSSLGQKTLVGIDEPVHFVDDHRFDEIIVGLPTAAQFVAGRADVVARTWATQFRRVLFGSIDAIRPTQLTNDSRHSSRYLIRRIAPLHPQSEVTDPHSTPGWTAIPLLIAMHDACPQCRWFFVADDDTFLVPRNLMHYIRSFNSSSYIYNGYVSGYSRGFWDLFGFGTVQFAVGGSGYFLSRALVLKILPYLSDCSKHTARMPYSDARLNLCIGLAFLAQSQCRTCAHGNSLRCWMIKPYFSGAPGVGVGATSNASEPTEALTPRACYLDEAESHELRSSADYSGYAVMGPQPQEPNGSQQWSQFAWRLGPAFSLPPPSGEFGSGVVTLSTDATPGDYLTAAPGTVSEVALVYNRRRMNHFDELATWIVRPGHVHPFRGVSFESYGRRGEFLAMPRTNAPFNACGLRAMRLRARSADANDSATTFAVVPCRIGPRPAAGDIDDNFEYLRRTGHLGGDFRNAMVEPFLACVYATILRKAVRESEPTVADEVLLTLHKWLDPRWIDVVWRAVERRSRSDRAHFVTFRDVIEELIESVRASNANDRLGRFVRAVDAHDFARGAEGDESVSRLFAATFNVSTHLHPICTVDRMAQLPDPILSLPFFAGLQQFVDFAAV